MATRALLHKSRKAELEEWLEAQGYMILATRSPYEALRCVKEDASGKDTVIIYQKAAAKEHLSVMDKDYQLIRRFIRETKEGQNATQSSCDSVCVSSEHLDPLPTGDPTGPDLEGTPW